MTKSNQTIKHGTFAKAGALLLALLATLFFSLTGCASPIPIELPIYAVAENTEHNAIELSRDGITYRPFGVCTDTALRGKLIGTREDAPESRICEVKGFSAEAWLVEYLDVIMPGGDMLWKAVGITDIPSELAAYRAYDYD